MTKFPAVFNVDNLNGENGFRLTSSSKDFGKSVAGTGDINGDGKPDLIVGTIYQLDMNKVYVIFGADTFPATFNTSSLNGTNGFTLTSSINSVYLFEFSVAGTGDINGDGKADLLVGAWGADKAFVIFGAVNFPATFDTSSLNGANGFTITSSAERFGSSVAGTGDINGDGKPDLIVGAYGAKKAYVIFGAVNFPATLDTSNLNGANGFELISSENGFGFSVAGTGDINGDGKPDLIVGASVANKAFVVFGKSSFPPILDTSTLNGTNGFTLTSLSEPVGFSVAGTGDINGDGKPDLIVGAYRKAYVIFGASTFSATLDTSSLNGTNGFELTSSSSDFGWPVAGTGDVNADGKPDLIVGASGSNKAYVIFGASTFSATFDTSSLNGTNGFELTSSSSDFGWSVAGAGDVNGDGKPGLIVGAYGANKAYVIFGQMITFQNYGMLSRMNYFVSMNSSESTGKMNIGSVGEWCNQDSLFIGDFNGDTRSDLLCSLENGQNHIMLAQMMAGQVTFVPMGSYPDGKIKIGNNDEWCVKVMQALFVGDFNGDGKTDLLCHNNKAEYGATFVMLSTGDGFKPMADSPDGYVIVGKLGNFCPIGGRLVVGNFDGMQGDDLLCNSPSAGNMIMVPNGKSFVSVNDDPLGTIDLGIGSVCTYVWCADSGSVLMAGHFNNDNRTDLICNAGGENQIMLATFSNISCVFQPIYPASGGQKSNGWISMGQGSLPIWCDASKSKLDVADINGDKLSDLVCNTAGVNQIQLEHAVGGDKYEFISINAGDPSGDGRTKIADYDKWCNSQNLFSGDFSGNTLDDLWCNQNYNPVGALADED